MIIGGFLGVSLLDFPGKISSIVFTSQCNFRCPFCHNPALVTGMGTGSAVGEDELLKDLSERAGFIEAVTVTGGEPCMHEGLIPFMKKIKELGLLIKLDTNGYMPGRLKEILSAGLADYVAMDIKSSPEKYSRACGVTVDLEKVKESVEAIISSGIRHEFRTTVVPGLVEEGDIEKICGLITGAGLYTLQQFDNRNTLDHSMATVEPHPQKTVEEFAQIAGKYLKNVRVTGAAARA